MVRSFPFLLALWPVLAYGWSPPVLTLQLQPTYARAGQANGLAVTYTIALPASARPLDLALDQLTPALERTTDQVTNLVVTDDQGAVPLQAPTRRPAGAQTYQYWRTRRAVVGTLHVRYQMPVAPHLVPKRGPHYDLQATGGGVAGAGNGFLLLPALPARLTLALRWQLPAGASGVSSYGPGDLTATTSSAQLNQAQFLAGPLFHYPARPTGRGFQAYGLGRPAAQMQAPMQDASRLYEALRQAFGASPTASFTFFYRSYPGYPFPSGVAQPGFFMCYLPPQTSLRGISERSLIAHEMVHAFGPILQAPPDIDSWYEEGIADYLSCTVPYQAGLYSLPDYLTYINQDAAYYYTNRQRLIPDRQMPTAVRAGRLAWTLPYARGMIYFANLDAKLRRAGSPHSVLSMSKQLLHLGRRPTVQDWAALLRRQAGAWAVADLQAMKAGRLLQPEPGAFGPGVASRPRTTGFFDLGFAGRLRVGSRVEQVSAHSPAARAGLRTGDELLSVPDLLNIGGSFSKPLTLRVRRGEQQLRISFQPRVGRVTAWEWVAAAPGGATTR